MRRRLLLNIVVTLAYTLGLFVVGGVLWGWAATALLASITGGVALLLVVGHELVHQGRITRYMPAMKDETLIRAVVARRLRGHDQKAGCLYLTTRRLIFVPIDQRQRRISIELIHIERCLPVKFLRSRLIIAGRRGPHEHFQVQERGSWVEAIKAARTAASADSEPLPQELAPIEYAELHRYPPLLELSPVQAMHWLRATKRYRWTLHERWKILSFVGLFAVGIVAVQLPVSPCFLNGTFAVALILLWQWWSLNHRRALRHLEQTVANRDELDRPPFCLVCDYDLRATPDRCPECGWQTRAPNLPAEPAAEPPFEGS